MILDTYLIEELNFLLLLKLRWFHKFKKKIVFVWLAHVEPPCASLVLSIMGAKLGAHLDETAKSIFFILWASTFNSGNLFYYRNFFEMVRFDFVLDEDMKLYLMEVCICIYIKYFVSGVHVHTHMPWRVVKADYRDTTQANASSRQLCAVSPHWHIIEKTNSFKHYTIIVDTVI